MILTRRQLLAAGLASGAGAVLAGCSGTAVPRKAARSCPPGSSLDAIEHVIILTQENRSFDNYFGSYRGVRGFDDHPAGQLGVFAQPDPLNTSKAPIAKLLPWHFDTRTSDAECTNDLTHNWAPQHSCWNGGRMDGFVTTHLAKEGPLNGPLTMGYYTRQDLSFYYALADAFTICDGYHCSVLGPTDPNRLLAISGMLDPSGAHGGPVLETASFATAPSLRWTCSWTTMPERLQANGVSWKIYNPPGSGFQPTNRYDLAISDNVLAFFKQFEDQSTDLHRNAFNFSYPQDFLSDLNAGNLPQVSWVLAPPGQDEHPPASPEVGEVFTSTLLSALVAKPDVWSKTVLFVTYDENDGFFDHVAPLTPPPGTKGEYLSVTPLPAAARGIAGPIGLGMRVPMLVVSPFSQGGYVCSDPFDHTSILRFLETRFGVEVPNLSVWRRSVTGDLTATLDMSSPDTSVPKMPEPPARSARVARECPPNEIITPVRPLAMPAVQSMPVQEPGTARRRRAVVCVPG